MFSAPIDIGSVGEVVNLILSELQIGFQTSTEILRRSKFKLRRLSHTEQGERKRQAPSLQEKARHRVWAECCL
jgi:hypothetical protein